MNKKLTVIAIMAWAALIASHECWSQTVRYVRRPDPRPGVGQYVKHEWTISFSRRHGPTVFALSGTVGSEGLARARIQSLINWSNRMPANSDWRLAVILVERKGHLSSGSFHGERADPNGWFSDVLNHTLMKVLSEVESASKRAKMFRDWAQRNVGKLTEQQFNAVNAAIDEYNATLMSAQSGPYGSNFRTYRTMPRVPRSAIRRQPKYVVWYSLGGNNMKHVYREYTDMGLALKAVTALRIVYGRRGYQFGYRTVWR